MTKTITFLRACAALIALLGFGRLTAQTLESDNPSYFPGEPIVIDFAGGPGNRLDWVGIYPEGTLPGTGPASTLWFYVNGSRTASVGFREGSLLFPTGLNLAGTWVAYFLVNDGYTSLTNISFTVVDPSTPAVRRNKRIYSPGENISVTFTNGPANAKDWIAVYRAGQAPGSVASTLWFYVDGTRAGNTGVSSGTISFPGGLAATGDYEVHLLENDGYTSLASQPFSVRIPAVTGPRLLSIQPAGGSTNAIPDAPFEASITNGPAASVSLSSVVLSLDGAPVTASVSQLSNRVTVAYTNATILPAGSSHTYVLAFADTASVPAQYRFTNTFSIGGYRNLELPAPIVFESFDTTIEGEVPTGWSRIHFTVVENEELDFGNLDSAAYANWTVVEASRFNGRFITYSNPETSDGEALDYAGRVNVVNPFNVVGGRVLREPLARGRFLFADSGYRRGAAQVQYLFTPDFNLTGRSNVFVAFKSLWEQNQDNFAGLEYSIDGGTNWLPIAYFIDGPDIVRGEDGQIDATATFTTERGDVARYTDSNGSEVGGQYGAFIAAPIGADLAPYIQARVNDDFVESKRYEWYRLPAADNAGRVRFRFAHSGTDSWYWGIDDFGLYATAPTTARPTLAISRADGGVRLSWPADTGLILESSAALGSAWTAVSGVAGNSYVAAADAAMRLYRLRQP
jgi:hypothetical protein